MDASDAVTLTLASDRRYARVARTVVASCASIEGFSVDDIDDVRLVVDTAFQTLVDLGAGPIRIDVSCAGGVVRMEMSTPRGQGEGWRDPRADMLGTVVSVVASEHELGEENGELVVRVTVPPRDRDSNWG